MYQNIILTGSLAFDNIFDIPDPFTKYILPDQIHKINVSIVTDKHQKTFGGTAGNQAFYLARLGIKTILFTAVGKDFSDYKKFLIKNKVNIKYVKVVKSLLTASGYVMTDPKDNQIWMFANGAMTESKKMTLTKIKEIENSLVLISPTNLDSMCKSINECNRFGTDFAFDPAFFIPHFPEKELIKGVKNAKIIFGNDYEITFIEKRLKKSITKLVNKNQTVVKTLGDQGSEIYYKDKWIKIPIYKTKTVDPTGAGDAYRSGFIFGYLNKKDIKTCALMGAVTSSFAVEEKGTMNLKFNKSLFSKRLQEIE